jgi:DNA-binding NtrC family response regulator
VPVIIITGYSTVKSAVEAIKMGAFDYLPKPFTPDELLAAVEKALRSAAAKPRTPNCEFELSNAVARRSPCRGIRSRFP